MKGQCLTKCGLDVDYEPIEFSDGFVYYLPRNLDKTVHNCLMVSSEIINLIYTFDSNDYPKDSDKSIYELEYEKNKNRTALTFEQFSYYLDTDEEIPHIYGMGGDEGFGIDFDLVLMLIDGKMLESKLSLESEMKSCPVPFFISRVGVPGDPCGEDEKISMFGKDYSNEDLAQHVILKLPTKKGYQLEYLGKIYELMIRLEDAKKCFELQFECTGEPELKEYVEKLDKSIEEKNRRYPKKDDKPKEKLTLEEVDQVINKTELIVQNYVVEIFENNFEKVWKKFPHYKKSIEDRRIIEENSTLPKQEKNLIQHLGMGQVHKIMKESRNLVKSNKDGKCKICNKKYHKGDSIFLEKRSIKKQTIMIICKNKECFENQGGLHKNISQELITIFALVKDARNTITHANKNNIKKNEEFWQVTFRRIVAECESILEHLEPILSNKKYT